MMTHDQEIEKHPFFRKHFKDSVGGTNKNPYTDDSGYTYKASYRKQGQHKRIYHTLKHLVNTKEGTHSVQLETRQKDFPLPIRSGDGDGKTVHEAMNNAIKNYKSDNWKPRAEKLEEHKPMKDFRDFVKTTYAGLMEVEGLKKSGNVSHREAVSLLKNASDLSSAPEKTDDDSEAQLHLHAVAPTHVKKLHNALISHGFEKQPEMSRPYQGVTSGGGGDGPIYHHYKKDNTSVFVASHPNTFGEPSSSNRLSHHHVEVVTPR